MASRRAAIAAVLCACFGEARGETAEALADQVMRALAALGPRSAAFVEEKRLPSLTIPLVSRGRLSFAPPDRLEKLTESPNAERLTIAGDRLTIAAAGVPERQVGLDESPALRGLVDTLRAVLAGDLATLRRRFAVDASGDFAGWRLTLVSRDPAPHGRLGSLTLEGAANTLRGIAIQGEDGTQTLMLTPLP